MLEIIKQHLETIKDKFDGEFTINQFGNEIEVTNVVYFESWDVEDIEEPLHVVAVYKAEGGFLGLSSVDFPFSPAIDWMQTALYSVWNYFFNKFFLLVEV